MAIPNDNTRLRPFPPYPTLSTTAAVAQNPPIEEEDDNNNNYDDDDGNTPPTNSSNERLIYPDLWLNRVGESQEREPIRVKSTATRIPKEANVPLQQDTHARLIKSSLQGTPNSNIISHPRPSPHPRPKRVEREESGIVVGGRG